MKMFNYCTLFFLALSILSKEAYGTQIHKRTSNFIDIEADIDSVWIACTDVVESGNSYLGVHILDGQRVFLFFYRRPLRISQCRKEEREYRKLAQRSKTVRLVGITPSNTSDGEPRNKRIPKRFTDPKYVTSSFFARLEAGGKCKSFFKKDCDLPKNYWAGTTPN